MGSARAPVASSGTWPAWTCRVSKDQFGVVSVIGFPCLSALLMYDEWSREVRGAPHARCGDTNKVSPRLRCAVIWRTAWSSPGAPHRGGGLPVSEPGLGADTHDLSPTIGRAPSHR